MTRKKDLKDLIENNYVDLGQARIYVNTSRKSKNPEDMVTNQYEDLGSARVYRRKTDKAIRRCHVYRRREDGALCMKETRYVPIDQKKLKIEFVAPLGKEEKEVL